MIALIHRMKKQIFQFIVHAAFFDIMLQQKVRQACLKHLFIYQQGPALLGVDSEIVRKAFPRQCQPLFDAVLRKQSLQQVNTICSVPPKRIQGLRPILPLVRH